MYSRFKVTQRNGVSFRVNQYVPIKLKQGKTEVHYTTELTRRQIYNRGERKGGMDDGVIFRRRKVIELFQAKQSRFQNYYPKPVSQKPKIRAVQAENSVIAKQYHNELLKLYHARLQSIEVNDGSEAGIKAEANALKAYERAIYGLKRPINGRRPVVGLLCNQEGNQSYPAEGQGEYAMKGATTVRDRNSYGEVEQPYVASVRQELSGLYGDLAPMVRGRKAKGYSFKQGNRLVF